MSRNRWLFVGVVLVVGAALLFAQQRGVPQPQKPSVEIGGQTIFVDLATTEATREQGLSGRESLAENTGMLFVFPSDVVSRFWMKEMNFSLDIIWISSLGRIIYIEPDLLPSTYPSSYGPTLPARYVLEVNAGFAVAHTLKVGDPVGLKL